MASQTDSHASTGNACMVYVTVGAHGEAVTMGGADPYTRLSRAFGGGGAPVTRPPAAALSLSTV